jgi:hypothetical protein
MDPSYQPDFPGFAATPDGPNYGADTPQAPPASMVDAPTILPVPAPVPAFAPSYTAAPDTRSARTGAGIGFILAASGTGLGFWLGGPLGAGAGLLLVGAARNTLRATRGWGSPDPVQRQDAGTSASLALFGAAIGGYLSYRVYSKRNGDE